MSEKGIAELNQINEELNDKLAIVSDINALNILKSEYLGKSGIIASMFASAKAAGGPEFREAADIINKHRADWGSLFAAKFAEIKGQIELAKLKQDAIDVTLPGAQMPKGSLHPVTQVKFKLIQIMSELGFVVADGPEIEDNYHNFEALNVPEYHPARGMQDTFYFTDGKLLRTQTSSVQIHALKNAELPLKIIAPGRVFRRDSDQTHSPMFHQLEMLNVAADCTFSDLKTVLMHTFRRLFGHEIKFRFRPSYFPFTEPSGELDIEWQGNWLEVAGYGMVHPNVLEMQGIDTQKYSGYAFGVGLDRLAMILYGIDDLRLLFQNDLRFLEQFGGEF